MCIRDSAMAKLTRANLRFVVSVAKQYQNQGLSLSDLINDCLLYTSDAADERSSVDLGGRRIIKKKKRHAYLGAGSTKIDKIEWILANETK